MKIRLLFMILTGMIVSCTSSKYAKEILPSDFTYTVIEDTSDSVLGKNELIIEINQKISIGQLATLADNVFQTKAPQDRFYIFYQLVGSSDTWATSHFDPDIEINILGFTLEQDEINKNNLDSVNVIGKWSTDKYGFSIVYFKDVNHTEKVQTVFASGGEITVDARPSTVGSETRIDYDNDHGEYFIIQSNGKLGLYSENGKYGEADMLK